MYGGVVGEAALFGVRVACQLEGVASGEDAVIDGGVRFFGGPLDKNCADAEVGRTRRGFLC